MFETVKLSLIFWIFYFVQYTKTFKDCKFAILNPNLPIILNKRKKCKKSLFEAVKPSLIFCIFYFVQYILNKVPLNEVESRKKCKKSILESSMLNLIFSFFAFSIKAIFCILLNDSIQYNVTIVFSAQKLKSMICRF